MADALEELDAFVTSPRPSAVTAIAASLVTVDDDEQEEEEEAQSASHARDSVSVSAAGPRTFDEEDDTDDVDADQLLGPPPQRSSRYDRLEARDSNGSASQAADHDEVTPAPRPATPPPPAKGLTAALFRLMQQPVLLLIFLCSLALVNYYDRGAFVGILPILQAEFNLDDSSAGLIGGAFIVGYSLVSPIMAQASRYVASGPILMIGMLTWVLATGMCTFANGFWFLMVARCLTGIGEAAFICLAPALIDDVAPPLQRTRWLAMFFSMLPIGYAFGYLGAGLIAAYSQWQMVFLSEALITLPLACLCIFLPPIKANKAVDVHGPSTKPTIPERIAENVAMEEAIEAIPPKPLLTTLRILIRNPTYMLLTLGYCAQTFVIGALTFWLPSYVVTVYGMDLSKANYVIGTVTAFSGIVGNGVSAYILDYFVGKKQKDPTTISVNIIILCSIAAAPFSVGAVISTNLYLFMLGMMAAEFLLLCTVTPVNAAFLSCVADDIRSHSMAMATMAIHLLGDMWSPYIYGAISDATGSQTNSLYFLTGWLGWTLLFWGLAAVYENRRQSQRQQQEQQPTSIYSQIESE